MARAFCKLRPPWHRPYCSDHRGAKEFEQLRRQLVSQGAELDHQVLVVERLPHGFGVFAGRSIRKGEVVASVPRRLVLEVPISGHTAPPHPLPFSAAAGGHGQWYDVMGSAKGRAAVTQAAAQLIREHSAGRQQKSELASLQADSRCLVQSGFREVQNLHSGPTAKLYRLPQPCLRPCTL